MPPSTVDSHRARRPAGLGLCLLVAVLVLAARTASAGPPVVAAMADAYIAHDVGTDSWTIGSRDLEAVIGLDASHTLVLQRLANPTTGRTWDITPAADFGITIGRDHLVLGTGGSLAFAGATADETSNGVQLTFSFQLRSPRLQISRIYRCYPGSPTIETWTRVVSLGETVDATDLIGWDITMSNARVRWLGGLRGDTANNEEAGAFELADRDLEPGERVEIGADGRSTEQFVPFVLVDDGRDEFFGGMMWSGSWRIAFERAGERLRVSAAIPGVTTTITAARALDLPHSFFGVTTHTATDESGALRQFIMNGIRAGRPFAPLVTYNTWFAYGTRIDEDTMVAEMDRAAALGVELFVIDAGWWVGAGDRDDFDFESGLGSWTPDPARFPSGLASLADYAHGLGMKFGIWVEPERVALSTVDKPGLAREPWLATRGGDYGAGFFAQICLARSDARQWVLERVSALIDQVHPDYLKWDNNFWINCDRSGHDHGRADGNLAHVQALYGLFSQLRLRYPDLLIENVSGGGNRLDFGMLAYTDTAWMDDRSEPSTHVRHNLEGLTVAFPPAYLLSFFIDSELEPIHGSADLASIVRSRMPGILGLTYRTVDLDDDIAATLTREIEGYKTYRITIADANATLLTDQAPVDDASWDVLQEVAIDGSSAVIFAFKASAAPGQFLIRPRSLLPDVTYKVYSVDVGVLGPILGSTLMRDGLEAIHSETSPSRAHIFVLTPQP